MIDDGLLSSFDELATETLPEWESDPLKRQITVRHLLELNGLHAQDVDKLQGCGDRDTLDDDLYDYAINVPASIAPGEQFSYGPVNYYAFGEILKRKLAARGQNPLTYLETRLFEPLGITYADWCFDASGNPHLPNGATLTAHDWARWGQFLLDEGATPGGTQLVSANLMRALREPSTPNPGHGMTLWLNTPGGASYVGLAPNDTSDPRWPGGFIYQNGAPDLFGALGGGKKRMYIVPSRDLVIVRTTTEDTEDFVDTAFLAILLDPRGTVGEVKLDVLGLHLDANLEALEDNVSAQFARDGDLLYTYQAGTFGANTQVPMASATKLVSAAVILKLVEEGVFALDDPFSKFPALAAFTERGKGNITIRQAWGMTSGLVASTPYQWSPLYNLETSVQAIAENVELAFAPGTQLGYDGKGMQVVGYLATQLLGEDWETIARTRLLEPCGMGNSDYQQFWPNPAVAGGLRTTTTDYMRFLQMLLDGGRYGDTQVLDPASVDILFTNQTRGLPVYKTPWPSDSPFYPYGASEPDYAFGAWVLAEDPDTGVAEEIVSPGAYGTFPWVDRSRNACGVVVVDVQADSQTALETELEVIELLRRRLDATATPPVRVIPVNNNAEAMLDPEVLSGPNMLTFQEGDREAWLASIDPETGLFNAPFGYEHLITEDGTPLAESNNGPEFGLDAAGWAVFLGLGAGQEKRIWRATLAGDTFTRTPITRADAPSGGMIVSRDTATPTTNLVYLRGTSPLAEMYWTNEASGLDEQYVAPWIKGDIWAWWMPGNTDLLFNRYDRNGYLQVALLDTATGDSRNITSDAADKELTIAWRAPEVGYDTLIAAVVDETLLRIYRETAPDTWTPLYDLPVPAASNYPAFGSPEPFVYRERTFFCFNTGPFDGVTPTPGEIWLMEMNPDAQARIELRVDDGAPNISRGDPEFYLGANDVYVFYNTSTEAKGRHVVRAQTGLATIVPLPAGEGEGTHEGNPEGAPAAEGEGHTEGEGRTEGTTEGEGSPAPREGETEGEGDGCGPGTWHTADQNKDGVIALSELLRVIQFFNSNGFGCQPGTEDGYAPNDPDQDCCPHHSDYHPGFTADWTIELTELLRAIQFFNLGGYTHCPGAETEDGYCHGTG